jgi:peptidoglycan/xylan/chitin deacetylase (PgdA/CDA1 family)
MRTVRVVLAFLMMTMVLSVLPVTSSLKAESVNNPLLKISSMEKGWIEEYKGDHTIFTTQQFVEGKGSLELTTGYYSGITGAYLDIDPTNFYLSGFRLFIRCSDWSKVDYFLLNFTSYKDWNDFYWVELKSILNTPPSGEWLEIVLSQSSFYPAGGPSWNSISRIQLLVGSKPYQPVTVGVDDLSYFKNDKEPTVSLTFDDGQESVFTMAKPAMDAYHYAGTMFSIVSYIGEPGFMNQYMVDELSIAGWDIGGHSDFLLPSLTPEQLTADLQKTKKFLLSRNYQGSDMYAIPYGLYNKEVMKAVASYFTWIRPDDSMSQPTGYISHQRINSQIAVPFGTPVSTVIKWIDQAIQNRDNLVLVFHKIVDKPEVDAEYSLEHFKAILEYMSQRNIKVVPLSKVVNGTY